MQRLDSSATDFADKFAQVKQNKSSRPSPEVSDIVSKIIEQIRQQGSPALLELTNKYDLAEGQDNYKSMAELTFGKDDFAAAYKELAPELAKYLGEIAVRIKDFHSLQVQHGWFDERSQGNIWGQKIVPLNRVGVYAPGGTAAYPSSVLMGCIPAKIAEVPEIIVASPGVVADSPSGRLTLAAAHISGADKLYAIGGAQAIAALALGTLGNMRTGDIADDEILDEILRVDKVVGPGNVYVTEAKRQLVGEVGIDSLAGPSELIIVADKSAPPAWVVADMFAQAEHAADTKVMLLSADKQLLEQVAEEINAKLPLQQRQDIIAAALNDNGLLVRTKDTKEAVQLADSLAPEHLQLMIDEPMAYKDMISQAAAVFCGINTSTVYGDYGAGPNHILPTGDAARFSSPLGVTDFTKRISFLGMNDNWVQKITPATAEIAKAEGLTAHAEAAKIRINQPVADSKEDASGDADKSE